MTDSHLTLGDCIEKGWVRKDVAEKMLDDITARYSRQEFGYVAWFKNGIGPPLTGPTPPFRESARWRDSFVVYMDLSKDPETLVVDAITQSQPI